jgi:hypothetical protein
MDDLNQLYIANADGDDIALKDNRAISADGKTLALFKNLETELLTRVDRADVIVGCVAWLTSEPILKALSKKKGVAIVVQKEDFLRPDTDSTSGWPKVLRGLYEAIPSNLSRYDAGWASTVFHGMSYASDPTIEAIRCVGNYNSDKKPAFPRAHHKFVVFCKEVAPIVHQQVDTAFYNYEPYEVWTGSFNFTKNAVRSFENAIVSTDTDIVRAFFEEAAQIQALSEPLNWESNWVAPEWRIGT